ncbi:MAG: plasmid recombination protein, partial [Clostridia bacterium]|nr:plasmid recombination protein [Clostridia bacterium]
MRRTISAMVGKGSANHNSRRFIAENVDSSRTRYNISYIDEPIKRVYHELFDEALERYNSRQTRSDRRIPDYYEKIRSSKQEKLFHEIILQIGDKDNMASRTENGDLARELLDEYFKGFAARNPNLRVFSAHIHMDEATPHIHIDFVPFTTGSKRGLDTRVSLKQALAAQGFTGGTRGDTEWAQWVANEKLELAAVMERYGIEWEQKGTHEKHLSVLDFKKQEREKELNALEAELAEKQGELSEVQRRLESADTAEEKLEGLKYKLSRDEDYAVPEPPK